MPGLESIFLLLNMAKTNCDSYLSNVRTLSMLSTIRVVSRMMLTVAKCRE